MHTVTNADLHTAKESSSEKLFNAKNTNRKTACPFLKIDIAAMAHDVIFVTKKGKSIT